jgi:hypothetical protein
MFAIRSLYIVSLRRRSMMSFGLRFIQRPIPALHRAQIFKWERGLIVFSQPLMIQLAIGVFLL